MERKIFVLYLWREQLDQERIEWRGRITYPHSGETYYFRDPTTLYQVLLQFLSDSEIENNIG